MTVSRVYVAHPMTCYGTDHERAALAAIARLLPGVEVIDPAVRYSCNAEWLADWARLVPTLSGLVLLADEEGTIGAGCVRELADALYLGLSVGAFAPNRGVVELAGIDFLPEGERCAARVGTLRVGHRISMGTELA